MLQKDFKKWVSIDLACMSRVFFLDSRVNKGQSYKLLTIFSISSHSHLPHCAWTAQILPHSKCRHSKDNSLKLMLLLSIHSSWLANSATSVFSDLISFIWKPGHECRTILEVANWWRSTNWTCLSISMNKWKCWISYIGDPCGLDGTSIYL